MIYSQWNRTSSVLMNLCLLSIHFLIFSRSIWLQCTAEQYSCLLLLHACSYFIIVAPRIHSNTRSPKSIMLLKIAQCTAVLNIMPWAMLSLTWCSLLGQFYIDTSQAIWYNENYQHTQINRLDTYENASNIWHVLVFILFHLFANGRLANFLFICFVFSSKLNFSEFILNESLQNCFPLFCQQENYWKKFIEKIINNFIACSLNPTL